MKNNSITFLFHCVIQQKQHLKSFHLLNQKSHDLYQILVKRTAQTYSIQTNHFQTRTTSTVLNQLAHFIFQSQNFKNTITSTQLLYVSQNFKTLSNKTSFPIMITRILLLYKKLLDVILHANSSGSIYQKYAK